jgi:prepilin signal peptidase PulO-like enzyme (type II secretory pathway)
VVKPVKAELVKTALIDEKGCKKDAKTCPFAPSLVAAKLVQLFWKEWRGRRDSNSRPLP